MKYELYVTFLPLLLSTSLPTKRLTATDLYITLFPIFGYKTEYFLIGSEKNDLPVLQSISLYINKEL